MVNGDVTIFGECNFRGETVRFGIKTDDRRRHMYLLGKTGVGKTTLLEHMAITDIQAGRGVGIVDPHGEFAEKMLHFVPKERIDDVIYFNPADLAWPIAFNVIEQVPVEFRHLVASGLMGVFKKIWPDVWSPRMEYILNNCILALLEHPDATLVDINRLLANKDFRKTVIDELTDPIVKEFWVTEYARYHDRFQVEAIAPIQNKVGAFISNPLVRNIVGQTKSKINMRQIMDEKKIVIMNLAKGLVGEDSSALLGAMLVTKLQLAAMSRVNVPESQRPDFYLYVDEFQNFATESFAAILSEARKYRLSLILAHQYLEQLSETVRPAIFGNVGTIITFRIGAEDAEIVEKEFAPEFSANDLVNLPKYNFYIKLMIDGVASNAFSANTILPRALPERSYKDEIIVASQERYGTAQEEVEKNIRERSGEQPLAEAGAARPQAAYGAGPVESRRDLYGARTEMAQAPMQVVTRAPMWETTCSNCQRLTQVPFQPDSRRPVYCRECLKARKETAGREVETRRLRREGVRTQPAVRTPGAAPISLEEAIRRGEPVRRREETRKGLNLQALREVLQEALEEKKE